MPLPSRGVNLLLENPGDLTQQLDLEVIIMLYNPIHSLTLLFYYFLLYFYYTINFNTSYLFMHKHKYSSFP